jgi:hypothetical protein
MLAIEDISKVASSPVFGRSTVSEYEGSRLLNQFSNEQPVWPNESKDNQ